MVDETFKDTCIHFGGLESYDFYNSLRLEENLDIIAPFMAKDGVDKFIPSIKLDLQEAFIQGMRFGMTIPNIFLKDTKKMNTLLELFQNQHSITAFHFGDYASRADFIEGAKNWCYKFHQVIETIALNKEISEHYQEVFDKLKSIDVIRKYLIQGYILYHNHSDLFLLDPILGTNQIEKINKINNELNEIFHINDDNYWFSGSVEDCKKWVEKQGFTTNKDIDNLQLWDCGMEILFFEVKNGIPHYWV